MFLQLKIGDIINLIFKLGVIILDVHTTINAASEAGRIILENGGETYRVEETTRRICESYGVKKCESFVTPTGIMVSAIGDYDISVSLVKRIHKRTINLEKVNKVNDLSRNIAKDFLTIQEFQDKLLKIDEEKSYDEGTVIIFSAFAAGFFTLLFGGTFKEFLISTLAGAIIKIMYLTLSKYKVNDFFINVLGGAISALIALIFVRLTFVSAIDKIIIGSIMLLAPGLAITNAIRDTIAGDLLSGVARALEAFLVAIGIAIGSGSVIKLWIILLGGHI